MWRAGGRAFEAEGTTSAKAPRQHLQNWRAYLGGSGQRSLGPSGTNQHKDDAFNLNEVEAIGQFQAKAGCDSPPFKKDPSGYCVENRL